MSCMVAFADFCISCLMFIHCVFIHTHRYNSSLEEDGRYAQVTCRPTVRTIESLNATVVLQKRGRSEVRHVDQIIALDNKFQPYNFQTHAGEMKYNVLYCNVHYIMSI